MLAEFRVSNYRSFKDEQVLSMIATSEESQDKNSVELGGHRILKTAAIFGANASGKSNLIKAMTCMGNVVKNSAGYKPGEEIPVTPFKFDAKTPKEPTCFETTFFIEEIRYQYKFSATNKEIHHESLLAWPKGREQVWFERNQSDTPYFGPSLKGQNKSTWTKVKENSLFLSVAAQWNHEVLSTVYNWFSIDFKAMPNTEVATMITDEMFIDNSLFGFTPKMRKFATKLLTHADFGINSFEIERGDIKNIKIPDHILNDVKKIKRINVHPPCIKTIYHCKEKYSLSLEEESDGTQKFYSFLGPLLNTVAHGLTTFKDELELNMHPLLTRAIIRMIHGHEYDKTHAQLIFTTHDSTLLDPELFGRDQVWFTEKGKDGATQLYSLADYKDVRKGEAMQKRYLAGRYGAIPILERFDLNAKK